MKKTISTLWVIAWVILHNACSAQEIPNLITSSFDDGWRFIKENPAGAENPAFNDSEWRHLDLPHDWSIEDLPNQIKDSISGPFTKNSPGKLFTGYTIGGTGWYRKTFKLEKSNANKVVYLQFDGVYMNSDVWVNGKHVGNHPYGYTSFYYNITPFLNPPGDSNIVAVRVRNEGRNARWYSGSGIYRHTWLTITDPVHIGTWGTYITTPEVKGEKATIKLSTNVTNEGNSEASIEISYEILNPAGKVVGQGKANATIAAGISKELTQKIIIPDPKLWSVDNPVLYSLRTKLVSGKNQDQTITPFGIRSIHFDAQTGFTLNGKTIKLRGGCIHHDNGPLGAVAIDRAEERKIEVLKKAGFNAIRCSHNPPSPALLDACDRQGMLVIDEAFDMWEKSKMAMLGMLFASKGGKPDTAADYSKYYKEWWSKDIHSMVVRDRNHPSVIMWSIGNEISEAADTSGLRIATSLTGEVRKYDNTRAVTEAHVDMGAFLGGANTWDNRAPHMALLDAVGYNYGFQKYETDHAKFPERVIYGSETNPPQAFENWKLVEKMPNVIGSFSWTAMDYFGEAGIGLSRLVDSNLKTSNGMMGNMALFYNPDCWPVINAYCGDIDLIGNPKMPSYYQQVVWRNSPVEMFVHTPIPEGKKEIQAPWGFPDELKSWTWPGNEGKKLLIHVYTRSSLVKLELNGKIVGEQNIDPEKSITASFEIPYEPGILVAHCFDKGKEMATQSLKTLGKPVSLKMTADRVKIKADRNDLSYVNVELLDNQGNPVVNEDRMISFEITGSGEIAGVGNGSPREAGSFQQKQKSSYQGKCLAILRPKGKTGKIVLTAKSEGLKDARIEIVTE